MCPIQTKLINKSLLTEKEVGILSPKIVFPPDKFTNFTFFFSRNFQKTHLNEYHAKVRDTLKPLLQQSLDQFTIQWLEKETQAI